MNTRAVQAATARPRACRAPGGPRAASFTPQHRELFDERPQQYLGWGTVAGTPARAAGRRGGTGLSAVAEHRPERSWRPHSCDRAQSPAACGLRPGRLLAEPRPRRGLAHRAGRPGADRVGLVG
ncbi:hypothetical protein ACPA9J_27905 [Pseudomonas aeruginosa]